MVPGTFLASIREGLIHVKCSSGVSKGLHLLAWSGRTESSSGWLCPSVDVSWRASLFHCLQTAALGLGMMVAVGWDVDNSNFFPLFLSPLIFPQKSL